MIRMQKKNVLLIARQVWKTAFRNKAIVFLLLFLQLLLLFGAYTGWKNFNVQENIRLTHQQQVRQNWENNPDKHPHRMAHYGYLVFRPRHKLSFFDFGIENFTGNAVFLEAHKQNSVNFSEAGFSTGLLRFGEISMAMVLQVLIPLLIFFLGYAVIATERENGTLKILLSQGAGWLELLVGKIAGLAGIAGLLCIPVILLTAGLSFSGSRALADDWLRITGLLIGYLVYFIILCCFTVMVSATSRTSKSALIKLLGCWLLFVIVLPRGTQALGAGLFPSPSRIAFETAIEKEVLRQGDSHNPDDPHYKAIKDSLLKAYGIDSVQQLPFNYSGFIMAEGEKLSAETYNRHWQALIQNYADQDKVSRYIAFLNPCMAIKQLSMALTGTDLAAYNNFQLQAEGYRYRLAQTMNSLQMQYISNKQPGSISHDHWKDLPDFTYRAAAAGSIVRQQQTAVFALAAWLFVLALLIFRLSKKLNPL